MVVGVLCGECLGRLGVLSVEVRQIKMIAK